jgi:mono/diheme cytochrome c family protein
MRKWLSPIALAQMNLCILTVAILLALPAVAAIVIISRFEPGARQEPCNFEIALATRTKRYFIRRSSRVGVPPPPKNLQASIEEGDKLFGTECAARHGDDGHKLTDAGRWMYPRAADLTSPDVQQYSDRELFWIVKNGIRLSDMPAFGEVEPDEHVWDLVEYVRTLQALQR